MLTAMPFYFLGYKGFSILLFFFFRLRLNLKEDFKELLQISVFFVVYSLMAYLMGYRIDNVSLGFLLFAIFLSNGRLNVSQLSVRMYVLLPLLIYLLLKIFDVKTLPSWISYHEIRNFGRGSLYFSEPSMLGLYYVNALLLLRYRKSLIFEKWISVALVLYSQSLGAYACLFFIEWKLIKSYFALFIFIGYLLLDESLEERIIYLSSGIYLGEDFTSSIGNRLNSAYFIFDYWMSEGLKFLGEGWGSEDTYIHRRFSLYSFTDLGQGDIKNIAVSLLYYFGVTSLILFRVLFRNITWNNIPLLLVLIFAYNWLQHPIVILSLILIKKNVREKPEVHIFSKPA
jgi:hypothetical protein